MFKKLLTKTRSILKGFKDSFGDFIGTYMLQCSLISLVFVVILFFAGDVELTFGGILETILSIPIMSVIVALIRLALKLVHSILTYGGVVRFIVDIIVSLIVIMAVGYYMPKDTNIMYDVLLIVFDLLYVILMVYLKKPDSSNERSSLEGQ